MTYVLLFGGALFLWWLFNKKPAAGALPARARREDLSMCEIEWDLDDGRRCTFVAYFDEMKIRMCVQEPGASLEDSPVMEYAVRRRNGDWEKRLSDKTMAGLATAATDAWEKAVAVASDEPTPKNLRRRDELHASLKEFIKEEDGLRAWTPLGELEPRVETAYQRYIHNA
jgi:hypothetical protein